MKIKWIKGEEGVAAIIMAVCLVMFLGFIALVVDLGYLLTARTQLHRTADASALAAAANLDGKDSGITAARNAAKAYAVKNQAAGDPVALQDGDIEFGFWDMPTKVFTAMGDPKDVNAVRVTARREASRGTALATTFARILGKNSMDVTASAVAEKGGPSQCVDAALEGSALDCNLIPIALCQNAITTNGKPNCNGEQITVQSTGTQSGAWTGFYNGASASNIKDYIENGDTPSVYARSCSVCTALPLSDKINVNNGAITSAFTEMRKAFDAKAEDVGGGKKVWTTYVPVACMDCQNPDTMTAKPVCVTGFAKFNIEEVCVSGKDCNKTGNKTSQAVYGSLNCEDLNMPNGGLGGPNFGTLAIPGLVQ